MLALPVVQARHGVWAQLMWNRRLVRYVVSVGPPRVVALTPEGV